MRPTVVLVLFLVVSCKANGHWNIELSPQTVASVPYRSSHLSVWQHARTPGRFYAMPLVCLRPETATVVDNLLTNVIELHFDVTMWSANARKAIYRHLKAHVNSTIVESQVEMLPMEKMKLSWKESSLSEYYRLPEQWRSNTHLPNTVSFKIICRDLEKCQSLETSMKLEPHLFNGLELDYVINAQKASVKRIAVTGTSVTRGNLYKKLANMPVRSQLRFLQSHDVKTLSVETIRNVVATMTKDEDFMDTSDELRTQDLLEKVFQAQNVSTATFQPEAWESVFWDEPIARPDKVTNYLNQVLTTDSRNASNFLLDGDARSTSAEMKLGISDWFDVSGSGGSGSSSIIRKNDILKTLTGRNSHVQWSGERFLVKPLQLFRLDLATLNSSTSIVSSDAQIRRYESVQSIKLRVECEDDTTEIGRQIWLSPLVDFDETELGGRLVALLNTTIETVTKLTETLNWRSNETHRPALGRNGVIAWPEYCVITRHDCGVPIPIYSEQQLTSLTDCKNLCNQDDKCKSFVHHVDPGCSNHNKCHLKEDVCKSDQLSAGATNDYYVKPTKVPDLLTFIKTNQVYSFMYASSSGDVCKLLGTDYQTSD